MFQKFILIIIYVKLSQEVTINCNFSHTNLRSAPSFPIRLQRLENLDKNYYRCTTKNLNITTKNMKITKVQGPHSENLTNNNVQWLVIAKSVVNFLPFDIENFFKNIQFLDISEVNLLELKQENMAQFPFLRFLWAIDNQITELDLKIFDFNLKLESIDFSRNSIRYLDYRMVSRIISRNGLEYFNINFEDNICIETRNDFLNFGDISEFEKCLRENEIFCRYRDHTDCDVRDAEEFLMVDKTEIIGDVEGFGHDDKNITKVSIESSNFTKIPEIFAKKFENLEVFEVKGKLRFLTAQNLKKFKKLKKLNLAGNLLVSLRSDTFVFNPYLEVIDLSSNKLEIFGISTFSILENLKILSLNNNNEIGENFKSKTEIDNSDDLKKMYEIDTVDCEYSNSNFRYSGYLYYCNVINPTIIDFDTINLENFHGFSGKHYENKFNRNVEALIGKYSPSTALDPRVSYHFPGLKTIRITKSNLTFLHPKNFHGLKNLKVLDFSENKITELPRGVFEKNERLIFVNFSANKIIKIYEIFGIFKNLKVFKIRENFPNFDFEFSKIDEKINEKFRKIPEFYGVTINCVEIHPEPDTLDALIFNTTCKDFSVQQITEIRELTTVNSKYDTKTTTLVHIQSQVMNFLPKNFSSFFPNLTILVAKGRISKILRENFAQLLNLEEIILANNEIEIIEDNEIFVENPKLKKVDLSQNKLKRIAENVFINLLNLENVVLERNDCALRSVWKMQKFSKNIKREEISSVCGAKLPKNFV